MRKKTWIRMRIVIVIVCMMCFSDWTFADEWEGLQNFWIALNYIVSILSWIWVLFAKIAWTFLTNKWVYGEILWWDALLWRFWNVMKNIANFGLWFYFVYELFKWVIKGVKNLKEKILWLLIAWIWIQASWFFTAVVVDVSTITLSAVGAFPAQVISGSPYVQQAVEQNLSDYLGDSNRNNGALKIENGKEISVFPKDGKMKGFVTSNWVKLEEPKEFERLLDSLTPNADDVSWPLYYLWFSILKATNSVPSLTLEGQSLKQMIFNVIINGLTTVIFGIEMLVLCVLALMRLLYLWMFIILSPIAVLLKCIEKSWQSLWDSDSFFSKLMKQIDLKSFFINVFKPTIIALWFWMAILFTSLMTGVIRDSLWKPINVGDTTFEDKKNWSPVSGNEWDQTYNTAMDNNLVSFTLLNVWKPLLDIILSIITVLMVYFILKIAVQMWKWDDFVSKGIWSVQDSIWNAFWSIPLVPVAWYDEDGVEKTRWIWAKSVFNTRTWESELLNRGIAKYQNKIIDKSRDQEEIIDGLFSGDGATGRLSADEQGHIGMLMRKVGDSTGSGWFASLVAAREYIKEISENGGKGMTLSGSSEDSRWWIKQFGDWLEGMKDKTRTIDASNIGLTSGDKQAWKNAIDWWNNESNKNNLSMESLFGSNSGFARAYLNFFLGNEKGEATRVLNEDISQKRDDSEQSGEGDNQSDQGQQGE